MFDARIRFRKSSLSRMGHSNRMEFNRDKWILYLGPKIQLQEHMSWSLSSLLCVQFRSYWWESTVKQSWLINYYYYFFFAGKRTTLLWTNLALPCVTFQKPFIRKAPREEEHMMSLKSQGYSIALTFMKGKLKPMKGTRFIHSTGICWTPTTCQALCSAVEMQDKVHLLNTQIFPEIG